MTRVAVIGLGMSGAFAARAAFDMGAEVEIFVAGDANTTPPGAVWLHWLPLDMTGQFEAKSIYVFGKGIPKHYVKRQWGTDAYSSSFPTEPVWELGFDPAEVLPHLVPAECELRMIPYPLSDPDIQDLSISYDYVFQTFPIKSSFDHQLPLIPYVAAAQFGTMPLDKNWVMYNGTREGIVVREAVLFGNHFLEFPKHMTLDEVKGQYDLSGWQTKVLKDIDPRCKPWEPLKIGKIHLIGRFAQWDRKTLGHDAYARVQKILGGGR